MSRYDDLLVCSWCDSILVQVHGHGACVNTECPMRGQNQDPCCNGETAG